MTRGRAVCAALLMLIATVAVIVTIDQQPNVARETKDGLVEEDLPSRLVKAAQKAGRKAIITEHADEIAAKASPESASDFAAKAPKLSKAAAKLKRKQQQLDQFGANCLTLKAYSIAAGQVDLCSACDPKGSCLSDGIPGTRALSILNTVMENMRADPQKANTRQSCINKFTKIIADLKADPSAHKEGLEAQMVNFISHQMADRRGLLVWGKIADRSANCACDANMCAEKAVEKGYNQYVYFDGKRIGFRGQVPVLSKLAVKGSQVMATAHSMMKHSADDTSALSHEVAGASKPFTFADFQQLKHWDGSLA
jgi:hypothetical protein